MRPVALVINANTTESGAIQEQASTITGLLLPASPGVPYKVFMAVPTVEAILEQVKTDLETRLLNPPVTSVLNSLNAGQIQILQQQSLIQQITQDARKCFQPSCLIDYVAFLYSRDRALCFALFVVMVLTKIGRCREYAQQVNCQIRILQVSALTGTGLENWYN